MTFKKPEFHIFICTNERRSDDPRGCCKAKGAEALVSAFKMELEKQGLKGRVRAQKAGCLDACEYGPTLVVYPEGIWYRGVSQNDIAEIVASHMKGGVPVARLLLN